MSLTEAFSVIFQRSQVYGKFIDHPRHFYILNKEGEALYMNDTCNDFIASNNSIDLNERINTYDLIPTKEADQVKIFNESVLKSQREMIFQERFTYDKYITKIATSIKAPFRDFKRNIRGIIGVSFIRDVDHVHYRGVKIELSPKKLECLYLTVKGYTYSEIAQTIHLSPRTIEHYMADLYDKFDCSKRYELVAHALRIEEIRVRLITEDFSQVD